MTKKEALGDASRDFIALGRSSSPPPSVPQAQRRHDVLDRDREGGLATVRPLGFLLLAASAVLLIVGSEVFAEHAGAAGRRFGVTALAIALILAGAEPEEMVTAIVASARHLPGIAAGDAIGANVTMLTIVLGLAALARPFDINEQIRAYAFVASAAGVIAALVLMGGRVSRAWGALLVAAYALAVAVVWLRERRPPALGEVAEIEEIEEVDQRGERAATRDGKAALLVVVGVGVMAAGGWLAVSGAEQIVSSLGLAQSVVGLTFVALVTTAELFALVWAAFRRGVEELAIAGVLGSAIYNATATLGVAALVRPLTVTGLGWQTWLSAAIPVGVATYALAFKRVGRFPGAVLVVTYGAFLAATLR